MVRVLSITTVIALSACHTAPQAESASLPSAHASVDAGIQPTTSDATDAVLTDELVSILAALPQVNVTTLGDAVYGELYEKRRSARKAASLSQSDFKASYELYPRVQTIGDWMYRVGPDGSPNPDSLVRFYFDLVPDHAVAFVDALTVSLDDNAIAFTFKIAAELEMLQRSSGAVLYVARADYLQVKSLVLELAAAQTSRFGAEPVAFAKSIAPGISVADEPVASPAPPSRPQHSFGSLRADALAESLIGADVADEVALLREVMRAGLAKYGIALAAPWLAQGKTDDDL